MTDDNVVQFPARNPSAEQAQKDYENRCGRPTPWITDDDGTCILSTDHVGYHQSRSGARWHD